MRNRYGNIRLRFTSTLELVREFPEAEVVAHNRGLVDNKTDANERS
jgi:hypothetical protein